MQDQGPHVILVRPKALDESRDVTFDAAIEALGFQVSRLPLLRHQLLSFDISNFEDAGLIVFTSATAVEALGLSGGITETMRQTPVLAVGPQTAKSAKHLGFADVFTGTGGIKDVLAEGLPWLEQNAQPARLQRLVYVSAKEPSIVLDHAVKSSEFMGQFSPHIQESLSRIQISANPVYETVEDLAYWQNAAWQMQFEGNLSKIRYLSFFSYRNAVSFCAFSGINGYDSPAKDFFDGFFTKAKVKALCSSRKTAQALPSELFGSVEVSDGPNRKAFLALLESL